MDNWWEIPLYSKFVEDTWHEINDGKIILAFIPEYAPSKFIYQFKSLDNNISLDRIDLADCQSEIESFLFNYLELDKKKEFIEKKASTIFNAIEQNPGKIIVFENIPNNLTDKFRSFINDLGRYLSKINTHERHKIIVLLDPKGFNPTDFTSETGISKILFQGVFDKLDFKLGVRYYYDFYANEFTHLYESIIASLSQFDVGLVEELVDCDSLIDDYGDVLTKYVKDKDWDKVKFKKIENLSQNETWDLWAKGILDIKNDKKIYHSAFLKIHNKESELTRRVWSAEIEILLPLIEELRVKIIESKNLIFPDHYWNAKTGEYKDNKMDFEIGEISYLINKDKIETCWSSNSSKGKVIKFIQLSLNIRNDLSHLRIPNTQDIKSFLKEYDSIIKLLKNTN